MAPRTGSVELGKRTRPRLPSELGLWQSWLWALYGRHGGSYSYLGGYSERERSPGATSSSEPIPLPTRAELTLSISVTLETRTAQGVIREEAVQEPDGTMCTEYTFPDGHVEWDYW